MHAGVIGLGAMGAPMARRLAASGQLCAVWNRTGARSEALAAELGVTATADPAALAAQCRIVIISVSDDSALSDVIAAMMPGLAPGTVIVDTSTVAPATARALAKILAARQVHLLDAPVSGGVEGAASGALVAMVGGDAIALYRAQPVFAQIASRILHLGPSGAGQAAKAVNQVVVAGINQAVSEGLAFADALGLPHDALLAALAHGMAQSHFLERRGATMLSGQFAAGFKVSLHQKDLRLCQDLARQLGAQLPLVEMTLIHYRRLVEEGAGPDDISALYRQKRQLFKNGD